jgi:hypothetical protein
MRIGYPRIEDLEAALPASLYRREVLPYDAAFLAGKAFLQYRRRRGARLTLLPDFYIGAQRGSRRLPPADEGRCATEHTSRRSISSARADNPN